VNREVGNPTARILTLALVESGWYSILVRDGYDGTLTGGYSLNLTGISTNIEDRSTANLPAAYELKQNYPNPFNSSTVITYSMPAGDFVTLRMYDICGQEVLTLLSEFQAAGLHQVNFDGKNLSSGFYLYTLRVGNKVIGTKKMFLLR
jgi:hypothetical protein